MAYIIFESARARASAELGMVRQYTWYLESARNLGAGLVQ